MNCAEKWRSISTTKHRLMKLSNTGQTEMMKLYSIKLTDCCSSHPRNSKPSIGVVMTMLRLVKDLQVVRRKRSDNEILLYLSQ